MDDKLTAKFMSLKNCTYTACLKRAQHQRITRSVVGATHNSYRVQIILSSMSCKLQKLNQKEIIVFLIYNMCFLRFSVMAGTLKSPTGNINYYVLILSKLHVFSEISRYGRKGAIAPLAP